MLSCLHAGFSMLHNGPHCDDLRNLVFETCKWSFHYVLAKAPDLLQSPLSRFCFCDYLSAFFLCVCVCSIICLQLEEPGCPLFPHQWTGLQVKASHMVQSVEPSCIYLGTVLPCLEGQGMEMRFRMWQDSEGDLRAWLELLVERHIIELSLRPTVPVGKPASWWKNIN